MNDSSISQRKQELVRQGAVFRSNLQAAVEGLPRSGASGQLLKTVLGTTAGTLLTAWKGGGLSSLRPLLPLATAGLSFLSARSLLKPVLRGAAVAATVAIAYRFLARKKQAD